MPEDNWVHRSDTMRCRTCIFFVPKSAVHTVIDGKRADSPGGVPVSPHSQIDMVESDSPLGRCRRHAPTLGGWPAVFNSDWCGDHKLDETKL